MVGDEFLYLFSWTATHNQSEQSEIFTSEAAAAFYWHQI